MSGSARNRTAPCRPAARPIRPGDEIHEETTVPDFLVTAMVIIIFLCCALALRVAGGNTARVVRVRRRPHRPNRAMMEP